ncbi:rhodanese-like domain-containing protein [Tepidibacter hydrothermalis]|uniref:Rhodanese-like domain-containing protein n=1 Tax=Tepidibacter hydrothermalis TaxID=3036126 RepID=A0ABY8E982_9FIRM|nr:rhodanese-like domain-containing protein [Tepidibacter hydrothermalis]WFD09429.1 rhodanese-like domain-containing protein [Tepidibacter hydrothermalis]
MKNFVDCTWLEKHMDDEGLFIIDCRFDLFDAFYGRMSYDKGHIKNAFYLEILQVHKKPTVVQDRFQSFRHWLKSLKEWGLGWTLR